MRSSLLIVALLASADLLAAQSLPLRQSRLDAAARDAAVRVPLDSTSDGRWLGTSPGAGRWDVEGRWYYFSYDTVVVVSDSITPEVAWWRVSRDGRRVESVAREAALAIPSGVVWTRDGTQATWSHRGELRIWERGKGERVLQRRAGTVRPFWSPDEREIRFLDDGDLYALMPSSGEMRQLTRSHTAKEAPKDKPVNAELKRQQLEIFDFTKMNKAQRDSADARRRRDMVAMPAAVIKPKATDNISALELPVTGRYVTYMVTPRSEDPQTSWANFVNDSGVVYTATGRAKVGAAPAKGRAAIVPADGLLEPDSVTITWVKDDTTAFGKPVRALALSWNRQGTRLVAVYASMDYKDRWVVLVNPDSGTHIRTLHHEHDEAWVQEFSGLTWLPDGEHIAVRSESSGWGHLYLVDMNGNVRPLTSGAWEVRGHALTRDERHWWLNTSEAHPSENHTYRMPLMGGARTRVGPRGEGQATLAMAPDERAAVVRWSEPEQLTDLYLMPSLEATPIRVTRSGTDAFWRIQWPVSDYVAFTDDRGDSVWARVYRPTATHPNRPAVMEIHGAGYAQGVHKSFKGSGAHGGSLYAKYLADRGVTYVVLDYRASAGYGRDVRTAIYRSMGDRDVASAVAAVPFLRDRYNVNPDRIGLFGCSYGGFYTLMALFKHPGVFKGGVAQCSVTDWAHYNHWYTARILNGEPSADSAAYRASSPIYHAAGLQDRLIIQHGIVDGNVQYQDAIRLVQRLMELGKDFEFVTYPIDAHGWQSRWAKRDSQRRMQKLWEDVLLN